MLEIADGVMERDTQTKPTMYQRISMLKQKYYDRKIELFNDDIVKTITNAQKCLKKIDSIETRSDIEMQRYQNTTLPGFLWQEKYIAKFYFFAVMIGYIDGRIQDLNRDIRHYEDFLWAHEECYKKKIANLSVYIHNLMGVRDRIISEYNQLTTEHDSFRKIADDILKTCPSYLKFTDLYVDSEENSLQLDLQQHLVTAYNVGFINCYSDYIKIMDKYYGLLSDYNRHHQTNQNKVLKEKTKKIVV